MRRGGAGEEHAARSGRGGAGEEEGGEATHILDVAEGVVHRDDLHALALAGGAADEAADAAEAGDAHLGRHGG